MRNVVGNADPPPWDINNRVRGGKAGGGRARPRANICTTREDRGGRKKKTFESSILDRILQLVKNLNILGEDLKGSRDR